jgi:hypothetical protein
MDRILANTRNTIQCNTIQCNTMQCNTIQYNSIQIQYNSIKYNICPPNHTSPFAGSSAHSSLQRLKAVAAFKPLRRDPPLVSHVRAGRLGGCADMFGSWERDVLCPETNKTEINGEIELKCEIRDYDVSYIKYYI